jgi:acetylornithine deacetylase/succinyl-diaminopimelate desuccinylase-like protein
MFEDRFNVFAEVRGRERAPALTLNAHIDTWMSRDDRLIFRDPNQEIYHRGWREGELLIGNPVGNDKGPLTACLIAAKALHRANVDLRGSVYLALVAGEIGQEPVDEFQGKAYLSKEVGARFLLNHSPRPSYCICAEATNFRMGWVEAGIAFHKITIFGDEPRYTPFLNRRDGGENPNAIIRALPVLKRLESWAVEYEDRNRYVSAGGTVIPRVNIGAIRSGEPSMILQSPEVCLIYLDVRTVPGQRSELISGELERILKEEGVEGVVEQFVNRAGYEAQGVEPLAQAVGEAHVVEFGEPCEIADSPVCSMWRDHNVFNEMGIPSLTYGPTGIVGGGQFAMAIRDLVRAARVYALSALALCR